MAEENTGAVNTTTPEGEGSQGDEGTGAPATFTSDTWREMIGEEWATDASLADFKSINDLAKSYVHAKKLIGSDDRVRIPKEDDTENWMDFYNRIGRPEEPSGYDFKIPDDAPGSYDSEQFQAAASDFRKTVHDLGLTRTQAEKLWDYQIKSGMEVFEQQQSAQQQTLTELEETSKKEFGQKLPEVIKLRNNIIKQYGDTDVAEFIKNNPIADRSPALLKMFENLGKALGEDKITREQKVRPMSPKEAKSKVNSITSDRNNPLYEAYHNRNNPRHKDAVDEVNRLWGFYENE